MRIIVVGCGRVGSRLALLLTDEGHDVVVMDKSSEALATLGSNFNGDIVLGTGIDEDTLSRAGIKNADALAAVTNNDNTNIMAAQVAKHVFSVPKVVARIYDPGRELIYHQLGLDTVSTVSLGVHTIRNLLTANGLRQRGTLGNGEVELVEVTVGGSLVGRKISDIELPGACRAVALIRGGHALVVDGAIHLCEADILAVAVSSAELQRVKAVLIA